MAKKRKKNSSQAVNASPARKAKANLKDFNWKLALILLGGCLLSSVLYFLLAGYRICLYVLFAYIIADCGMIIGYFIYNRGFVDKDATLDNLPDTMTLEEKQEYIDSIALRKKKSRWMPVMVVIISVPLMLDTLNIFVIEGLLGWKIF